MFVFSVYYTESWLIQSDFEKSPQPDWALCSLKWWQYSHLYDWVESKWDSSTRYDSEGVPLTVATVSLICYSIGVRKEVKLLFQHVCLWLAAFQWLVAAESLGQCGNQRQIGRLWHSPCRTREKGALRSFHYSPHQLWKRQQQAHFHPVTRPVSGTLPFPYLGWQAGTWELAPMALCTRPHRYESGGLCSLQSQW